MKHVFPFMECSVCGLPSNAMCEECDEHYTSTNHCSLTPHQPRKITPIVRKIFIGSGEDGHLYSQMTGNGEHVQ